MKMRISRRDFIKNGAMGLVGGIIIYSGIPAVLQGLTLTDAGKAVRLNRPDGKEHYWRFIVDMGKCIGCGKCVKGCSAFGNGSLYLQVRHDRCCNCNECAIAVACPSRAFVRVSASDPYLLKDRKRDG